MLVSILLTVAASAHSPLPAPSSSRALAAGALIEGLAEIEVHQTCVHRLPILLETGQSAAESLGDSAIGDALRNEVLDARWRGITDEEAAAGQLERALGEALADLQFEPVVEAELPEGFPSMTPVGEIELKRYPRYRMARAEMDGGRESGAFWRLFRHIEEREISMTAPVEMTYGEGERELREVDMAFMYEHAEQGRAGVDGAVEVVNVQPMLVASLGCRGASTAAAIAEARIRLTAWIASRDEFEPAGPMRQLGYNGPMVSQSRRYFEVQIPVRPRGETRTVIDFTAMDEAGRWGSVDDAVMGGISVSRFARSEAGTCLFVGNLSLENNGGFASVRTDRGELELDGAQELTLSFRGDGKAYRFRMRTGAGTDVPSYQVTFDTEPGVWMERSFRIDDFRLVWRGRAVADAPPLDPAAVLSLGFGIADGQAGSFRLELRSLSAR